MSKLCLLIKDYSARSKKEIKEMKEINAQKKKEMNKNICDEYLADVYSGKGFYSQILHGVFSKNRVLH